MKTRWIAVLLCGIVLLGTGCAYAARELDREENCYRLYFTVDDLRRSEERDAIGSQLSTIRKDGEESDQVVAQQLMNRLLAGPDEEGKNLKTPFPAGTQLLSVTLDGTRALVDLSPAYSTLSGVALTLADYCITLTLAQIPNVYTVAVTVHGKALAWNAQTFTAGDVELSTTEDVVSTVTVDLFFPDSNGLLTAERRTLDLYEGDTQAKTLVEALKKGPEDEDLLPALPDGFAIMSVWTEETECYVNLPSSALEEMEEGADLETAFRSLTRSLCSLPAIEEVQFLVDSEFSSSYGGVDISRPFTE